MSLADLLQAKKTQRDKDWPMIRRMVEADIARAPKNVPPERVEFWLRECRNPESLVELVGRHRGLARRVARQRPAVRRALAGDRANVARELGAEEEREREADRRYWRLNRKRLPR